MKIHILLLLAALMMSSSVYSKQWLNISYVPKSETDAYLIERGVLDIFCPKDKQNQPVIIWFHGGGLRAGEKTLPQRLLNQGVCVVAPNYRLYPKIKAPGYIEDAASAVAWVFKNIENYGGDPGKIILSGHSAGGYLALMVGMDTQWLAKHNINVNRLAELVPFSGHTITHFTVRDERGIKGEQPIIDELAPLYHVRKDAPPITLITGDRELELLGRYEENAYFARMMKVNGHKATQIFELDGYGHNMVEPALPLLLNIAKKYE
ncbi:alpha/beta hydrolase [Pseudoalteromonas viridis]|uniref:Alpha/beta hydrolase n=1 Tax=Pseudoalteromonas viridis TaxID=339617 RepID=A0ABX7V0P9_9GAMM|nr:alpha/beta hydrolase [Pseudoalteromonas viridis]QTL34359.1 alpha/beta hydrolase [Pseudoalteromonas viridis]